MTVQQFRLPDVGEGLTEAEIVNWRVAVGDIVAINDVLVEIETEKSLVELPSPFAGTVSELHVEEGTTVAVGSPIVSVEPGGNQTAPDQPSASPTDPAPHGGPSAGAPTSVSGGAGDPAPSVLVGYGPSESRGPRRRRRADESGALPVTERADPPVSPSIRQAPTAPRSAVSAGSIGQPIRTKPPVRKLAKSMGVDLTAVLPSGALGLITREDVLRHVEQATIRPSSGEVTSGVSPDVQTVAAAHLEGAEASTRIPVKGVRRAIANAMTTSAFTAPHVTEFVTVDVTRSVKLVEKLKNEPALTGSRVTMLLLAAKALLVALAEHPDINASWDDDTAEIVLHPRINLGIAAATPRGLMVPNIKDAGSMAIPALARALTDLVTTARDGKSTPQDMARGTVTITNIGVFGVDAGTPILNPGEAAILCLGAVRRRPWEHKGKVALRSTMQLALSFDHRLVDGELGSRVLARVGAILVDPRRELLLT